MLDTIEHMWLKYSASAHGREWHETDSLTGLLMSLVRGRPEMTGSGSNRRDCPTADIELVTYVVDYCVCPSALTSAGRLGSALHSVHDPS